MLLTCRLTVLSLSTKSSAIWAVCLAAGHRAGGLGFALGEPAREPLAPHAGDLLVRDD